MRINLGIKVPKFQFPFLLKQKNNIKTDMIGYPNPKLKPRAKLPVYIFMHSCTPPAVYEA